MVVPAGHHRPGERVLEGPEHVVAPGRYQLVCRVVAARHPHRHGPCRLGGLDVVGGVAHDVDLGWGELVVQPGGLVDGERRQLSTIGRVRAVGAEDEEPG